MDYLTVDEVAERLRVHPRTVKRWLAEGTLRGKLLGDRAGWRIAEDDMRRFMEPDSGDQDDERATVPADVIAGGV